MVVSRLELPGSGLMKKILPVSNVATRWNRYVPKKVNIHIWRVLLDRLPTRINLENRDIDIPSSFCPCCELEVEHLDHLFVHCEIAARTWDAIFRWLEMDRVEFQSIKALFDWIDIAHVSAKQKEKVDAISSVTV